MRHARRWVWYTILATLIIGATYFVLGGWSAFSGPYVGQAKVDEALRLSERAYDRNVKSNWDLVDVWWNHQILTWKWWMNVGMASVPWLVWARLRRKESAHRLLYLGFVLLIIASYMDFIGVTYGFWRYHIEVVPTIPSYIPWDFSMYPVAGMLLFQYEPALPKYLKAVLFACLASFVFEPTFKWLQFYEPYNWSSFYSFPIHFVNYLIANWFGTRTAFKPLLKEPVPAWEPPKQ